MTTPRKPRAARNPDRQPTGIVTAYVIQLRIGTQGGSDNLREDPRGDTWVDVANVSAQGAETALRRWIAEQGDTFKGGVLRAIPLRSARPVTVGVETQTRIKLT